MEPPDLGAGACLMFVPPRGTNILAPPPSALAAQGISGPLDPI